MAQDLRSTGNDVIAENKLAAEENDKVKGMMDEVGPNSVETVSKMFNCFFRTISYHIDGY
jgi:hypothetical protein